MDEIIKKYANDVKRFCMSLCHDEYIADELTQETFFRALRTIKNYDGSCAMTTWLFQIAKRSWIDSLRKNKNIISLDDSIDSFKDKNTPETLFYQKMQREYLDQIIEELDEPNHTVFLMRALLDKSFSEIGKEFGKSENWARVTYYRTRIRLMERVKKDEDAL